MTRIAVQGLIPDTDYVYRIRASNGIFKSEWSPIALFTTITDAILPNVPTGFTWVVVNNAFHAEWNAVTQNVNGEDIAITRYELELVSGATTKIVSVPPATGDKVTFDLSFEQNVALFGSAQPAIIARVRSVDNKELKSSYTSTITATNAVPNAPATITGTAALDSIGVKWDASTSPDVIRYEVHVSTVGTGFTPSGANMIFSGNALSTFYQTATYIPHYFKVAAVDEFGQKSSYTVSTGVTPTAPAGPDVTAPGVPTGLAATITANSNGVGATAAVSWTAVVASDLAGYVVRYRRNGSSDNWTEVTVSDDTIAVLVPLNFIYTSYDFQVRSFDFTSNFSAWSSVVTASGGSNTAPANVTGLVSTPGKNDIIYSWTGVADTDIKNYEFTFSTSPTFASGNVTYLTGTSTTLTVAGLAPSTTYYGRVRAVDTGGLTSASFSSTDTETTLAYTTNTSDGAVPSGSPAATVTPGIGYLFVSWPAQANADPVTYEVHISTTTGFTPTAGGATMVAKTSATNIGLEKDAAGTVLAYGTTYYVKIFARDADGPASAAGTQGSGAIAQAGTVDMAVNSITAASGILADASIGTAKIIDANITTVKIADANITTAKIANLAVTDAKIDTLAVTKLTAGTVGGGFGITMAAGSNILLNGGYIKSNTYTGTTQASNPSGVGFYLGNDGLRVDSGKVSASSFSSGEISTASIMMSGGSIYADDYNPGGSGWIIGPGILEINDGTIRASAIYLQSGHNLLRSEYASFQLPATFYTATAAHPNATITDVVTTPKYGTKSLNVAWDGTGGGNFQFRLAGSSTDYNIPVEPLTDYIVSAWVRNRSAVTTAVSLAVTWSTGAGFTLVTLTPTVSSSTWVRMSATVTSPSGATGANMNLISGTLTSGANFDVDGVQFEIRNTASNTPSQWMPPGVTTINGNLVRTGAIQSTATALVYDSTTNTWVTDPAGRPAWYIDTQGVAQLGRTTVTGNLVVGQATDATTALANVQSFNYVKGSTGWIIRGDGYAEFRQLAADSIDGAAIRTNTLDVQTLKNGDLNAAINVKGSIIVTNPTTFAQVGMSYDRGFFVYGPSPDGGVSQGPTYISFPVDGAPNIISGVLKATTLEVSGNVAGDSASFYKNSTIQPLGKFTLLDQAGTVGTPPTVAVSWALKGMNDAALGTLRGSLQYSSPNYYGVYYTSGSTYILRTFNASGVNTANLTLSFPSQSLTVVVGGITTGPYNYQRYGSFTGLVMIGTTPYVLGYIANNNDPVNGGNNTYSNSTWSIMRVSGTGAIDLVLDFDTTGMFLNGFFGAVNNSVGTAEFVVGTKNASSTTDFNWKLRAFNTAQSGWKTDQRCFTNTFATPLGTWNVNYDLRAAGEATNPQISNAWIGEADYGAGNWKLILSNPANFGDHLMFASQAFGATFTTIDSDKTFPVGISAVRGVIYPGSNSTFEGVSSGGLSQVSGMRAVIQHSTITWTTGTTGRWGVATTRYDTVNGYQSTASPVSYFNMSKRASLSVTADSGSANAARIYVGRKSTDTQNPVTEMWYQSPNAGTGVTVNTYNSITFSGTNAPSSNTFPAAGANGGQIISVATDSLIDATSSASTIIRADGFVRMKSPIAYQITLRNATAPAATSGLETALRIGTLTGTHLRFGPSGVFGMNSDTVQGSFQTNNPVSEMRNTNPQSLTTPWTLVLYGVGSTRGNISQSGAGFHTINVDGWYLCTGFVKTTIDAQLSVRTLCKIETYTASESLGGGGNIAQDEQSGASNSGLSSGPGTWNPVGIAYLTAGTKIRLIWYNNSGTFTTHVDNTPFAAQLVVAMIA